LRFLACAGSERMATLAGERYIEYSRQVPRLPPEAEAVESRRSGKSGG
jgi:hypothetical protein